MHARRTHSQQHRTVWVSFSAPVEELPRPLDTVAAPMQHRGRGQKPRIVREVL